MSADPMQDPVNTVQKVPGGWGGRGQERREEGQLGRSEQGNGARDRRSYVLLGGQMWRGGIQGRGWARQ
jgi:hypothetical protein